MEFLYRKLIGPIDPSRPTQSLQLMIKIQKFIGLYPPDNESKRIQILYGIYATVFRILFLHLFSSFQAVFFLQISNIKEVADALFMFMTEISLMYKTEIYFINRFRFKAIVERFNSGLFRPVGQEQEAIFRKSMLLGFTFHIVMASSPSLFISGTAVTSLIKRTQLVPSWYPIDNKPLANFLCIWLFQVIGLAGGAAINCVYDPTAAAILLHVKCELQRLGIIISRIGHRDEDDQFSDKNLRFTDDEYNDEEFQELNKIVEKQNQVHGKNYADLVKCIIYHKKLLEFTEEIEDMLKKPLFCQFIFSTLIICMTMAIMAEQENLADIIPFMAYLMGMILQIFMYCYSGNEITEASKALTQQIYSANFVNFDSKTKRILLLFMLRTQREIVLKAGTQFQVSLSMETFSSLINTAYSYFTILRTMQDK